MSKLSIILLLLISFSACNNIQKKTDNKLNVVVSILPFKEIVDELGGQFVNTEVIIKPGHSPENYDPSVEDIKTVTDADAIFIVGKEFNFEEVLLSKLDKENKTIIDCSNSIFIVDENPHYWLGISEFRAVVNTIRDELILLLPKHKSAITTNAFNYFKKFNSLVNSFDAPKLKGKNVIVYHPAWLYLFNFYEINMIAIEEEGKEATPQTLKRVIDFAKENSLTKIFVEPQTNKNSANAIAKELNGEIVILNPLPENNLENFKNVIEKLK